jgi:hypothetical protein
VKIHISIFNKIINKIKLNILIKKNNADNINNLIHQIQKTHLMNRKHRMKMINTNK